MTLDPTIEARVRAKRAAPLDQDADALALLAEVERLRARAEKADAEVAALHARAEKADEEKALRVQIEREREAACKERDAFAADNAALRREADRLCRAVRLSESHGWPEELVSGLVDQCIHTEAALSAPAPGDGYVVLTREEAEEIAQHLDELIAVCTCRCDEAWTSRGRHDVHAHCAPLDPIKQSLALLRGKVKP